MRRDKQRLDDILDALDWIANAVSGKTETDFVRGRTLWVYATFMCMSTLASIGHWFGKLR